MRLPQWEFKLVRWCEQIQRQPFEWGKNDCALMAASCAEAITGTHPEPDLIGSYYSPFGAYRVLHERDGLSGICDRHYERIHPDFAQRGDILLLKFERKESLGICLGSTVLAMGERPTVVSKKELNILNAWRVE